MRLQGRSPDVPPSGLPGRGGDPALPADGPAVQPAGAGLGTAAATARRDQRRRVRRRLVRRRRPGAGQVPAGKADLVRPHVRRSRQGDQEPCGAGRGPRRHLRHRGGGDGCRALCGGPLAVQPQRGAQRLAGNRGHAGGRPPGRRRARARGPLRLGRHLGGRAPQAAGRQRAGRGTGGDHPRADRPPSRRPVQLPAHRRRDDRRDGGRRHPVLPGQPGGGGGRLRARRRRARLGRRA